MRLLRCRDDMKTTAKQFHAGFTLVEAVIVIAITGIIAAVVAVFIRAPVQGYFDSAARAELTDVADTALRRMTRDIRLALPNSIRIGSDGSGNQYIEFLITESGGRYLDESDNPGPGSNILDFSTPSLKFDVIGPPPVVVAGNYVVVYNLGPGMNPADAYQGGNRALVSSVLGNTITLASNPFAAQSPSMRSPGRRFQVVTTPVTYGCINNTLTRYWGYPISAAQSSPPAGSTSALLATQVTGCAFSYANLSNIRSGLVGVSLTLQRNGESITLFQQAHVDNTP